MNKAKKLIALAAGVAALTATAAAAAGTTLSLVGYSTPKTVMGKIVQAWQQTLDGKDISFSQSYGASTDQARAVANGLKADLVFLSTGDDGEAEDGESEARHVHSPSVDRSPLCLLDE